MSCGASTWPSRTTGWVSKGRRTGESWLDLDACVPTRMQVHALLWSRNEHRFEMRYPGTPGARAPHCAHWSRDRPSSLWRMSESPPARGVRMSTACARARWAICAPPVAAHRARWTTHTHEWRRRVWPVATTLRRSLSPCWQLCLSPSFAAIEHVRQMGDGYSRVPSPSAPSPDRKTATERWKQDSTGTVRNLSTFRSFCATVDVVLKRSEAGWPSTMVIPGFGRRRMTTACEAASRIGRTSAIGARGAFVRRRSTEQR